MFYLSLDYCSRKFSFFLFLVFLFAQVSVNGQSKSYIKGFVYDATTNRPISGVSINRPNNAKSFLTAADGKYILPLEEGLYGLQFYAAGYQKKIIQEIDIKNGVPVFMSVYLRPLSISNIDSGSYRRISDSAFKKDSVVRMSYTKSLLEAQHLLLNNPDLHGKEIRENGIDPGTDKDLGGIFRRLPGLVVIDRPPLGYLQSLQINGMGERYNQVLLDGQVQSGSDALSRQYNLSSLPPELIESVTLHDRADASMPADFSGGSLNIKLKDIPGRNYFYVQAGAEIFSNTYNERFYGDQRKTSEWISAPFNNRKLPSGFPSTRSKIALSQKEQQEKTDLLATLENNLAPQSKEKSIPSTRFIAGYGRNIKFKKGAQLGITAYLQHQLTEQKDASVVQVGPDLISNPYPFSNTGKPLIRAYSDDINYRYQSQLNAVVNAAVIFRKNKIAFHSIFGNQFNDTYSERSGVYKPDEDTLATKAISYRPEQRKYLNIQLLGEHALGTKSNLKLDWQLAYNYFIQDNADERNFLLRENPNGNQFELATLLTNPLPDRNQVSNFVLDANLNDIFTNSNRTWRTQKDHQFTGWVNLSFPFNFWGKPQVLKGGVYLQSTYREFYNDVFMYRGKGFYTLDSLIAPDRYYPGGVDVEEYYTKIISPDGFFSSSNFHADNYGNYTGSGNIGSSFLQYSGKLMEQLLVKGGVRVESGSQLVSSTEYYYFEGFKNPQLTTLNENALVSTVKFLPSVELTWKPLQFLSVQGSYFKTLNRPNLQELSPYRYYDPTMFLATAGNPFLVTSETDNFQGGVHWTPGSRMIVSVTGFIKRIDQPIENVITLFPDSKSNYLSTPQNVTEANLTGIQVGFNYPLSKDPQKLISYLSVFAQGSWTKSVVDAGVLKSYSAPSIQEHSLAGTPELAINGGLLFQHPRWPQLSVMYSRTSDYLHAVGSGKLISGSNGNEVTVIPDYRIAGRSQLGIQASQRLFKSAFQLIIGAQNLLSSPYVIYQDLNGNDQLDDLLVITKGQNGGGYYQSGTDNAVLKISDQKSFYLRISYTF